MTEKQRELINNLKNQKNELYEEKNKCLKEFDIREKKIINQIKDVKKLNYYFINDILDVIAYLVSKKEQENYVGVLETIPINIYSLYEESPLNENQIIYLTKYNNSLLAQKEIKQKFLGLARFYICDEKRFAYVWDILSKPSSNYIQISACSKIYKEIFFLNYPKEGISLEEFLLKGYAPSTMAYIFQNECARIIDANYFYIYDFIDYLIDKRLEKPDYSLTKEEMYECVDAFLANNISRTRIK